MRFFGHFFPPRGGAGAAAVLAAINQNLSQLNMKVSEALAALAGAKAELTKASAEILAKIEELKSSDPDISPEGQATVEGIVSIGQALDNIVPDPAPTPDAGPGTGA